MTCPHCGHTRHYAGDGLLSCAKCGRWIEPDANYLELGTGSDANANNAPGASVVQIEGATWLGAALELVRNPPPAVAAERTVTIAGTGRGKRKGKR